MKKGRAAFVLPFFICDYNLNNLLSFDDDTKIFPRTMRYG